METEADDKQQRRKEALFSHENTVEGSLLPDESDDVRVYVTPGVMRLQDLDAKYLLHDSGERTVYETGAQRDPGPDKPALELISPFFLERLGHHLRKGAGKYSPRNWEKGLSMDRCVAGVMRHINQFRKQENDEDHLAAAAFNVMCLIHFEEMIKHGKLPKEIDDVPRYGASEEET